jgi:CRISPR/Cas system-associated exonuclease Cas4 (RecB family)
VKLERKAIMGKRIIILVICIAISIGFYLTIFNHTKIMVNDVKLITVDNNQYNLDVDNEKVAKIISMFNKARRFTKNVDTTPSHRILIELKDGRKIEIWGNTQSFQYVNENGKNYKILSKDLADYFRSLDKAQ